MLMLNLINNPLLYRFIPTELHWLQDFSMALLRNNEISRLEFNSSFNERTSEVLQLQLSVVQRE